MRKNRFFIWAVWMALCSFIFTGCEAFDDGSDTKTAPTLYIRNASATEGDTLRIPLSLNRASLTNITLTLSCKNVTADSSDYISDNLSVTIPAGDTLAYVSIPTTADIKTETDETFMVSVKSIDAGFIKDSANVAIATILDDKTIHVVTFEDVTLGANGYWNGSDLSGTAHSFESWGQMVTEYTGSFHSENLTCVNNFNATYYSWSGIACSSLTDMESIGYGNQYSVYAKSGAEGSTQFALLCPFDSSYCSLNEEALVKSLMINNATYTYLTLKEGTDGTGYARKFVAGDYYYITITGFNKSGIKTGSINYYLADFRDGKSFICKDWTKVNLEALGKIKSMSFKLTSTDSSYGYMNTPGYASIDNIVYKK